MRDAKETLQVEESVGLAQRAEAESDQVIWSPPVLTTLKIEEETLGLDVASGPE